SRAVRHKILAVRAQSSRPCGRDGAFYGFWHNPPRVLGPNDHLDGPFVLQPGPPSGGITPSDLPSCQNGWNRSSTSPGGISVPVLLTVMTAFPALSAVVISASPPGRLCRMALSMRLATRLAARLGS